MPKFNVDVPHTLSREEATDRLNRFLDMIRGQLGDQVSDLEEAWDGDALKFSFKTFGIQIKGDVTVADEALKVAGDLPFAAMMFKGKIESQIKEQLAKLVS